MAKEKKPMTTLHKRNALRLGARSLKTLSYGAPVIPVSIMVGINWDEWFVKSGQGWSVSMGFIMLILSTLLTYLSIAKKKKLIEKFSAFWNVALIVICWAISFLFLSSILRELGMMLLYIGFSLVGAAISDEVETRVIEPKLSFYQGLVSEYGLDKKEERRKAKLEAKRKQAEEEAKIEKERQAID